jgi:hypothetical protein
MTYKCYSRETFEGFSKMSGSKKGRGGNDGSGDIGRL